MSKTPKKRGRKPIPDATDDGVILDEQALAARSESIANVQKMQDAYTDERDYINQLWGEIKVANTFRRIADVISLSRLKWIKESGAYKALKGKKGYTPDGVEIADVGTFEGFCQSIGLSRSKVDEDIKNFAAFGQQALADLQSIGVGYREFRVYRKLPEESRGALAEAAKSEDKEAFFNLAEELIAKQKSDKDKLQTDLDDARADLQAKDERISKLSDQVNQQHDELAKTRRRLAKLTPNETADQMALEFGGHKIAARNHYQQIESDVYAYIDYCHDHGIDYADVVTHHINDLLNPLLGMLFDLQLRGVNEPAKHAAELVRAASGGGTGAA